MPAAWHEARCHDADGGRALCHGQLCGARSRLSRQLQQKQELFSSAHGAELSLKSVHVQAHAPQGDDVENDIALALCVFCVLRVGPGCSRFHIIHALQLACSSGMPARLNARAV